MSKDNDKPTNPENSTARPSAPLGLLVSGGYDPDCELCRALSDPDPEVFGDRIEEAGVEVRQVLDVERLEELFRKEKARKKGVDS